MSFSSHPGPAAADRREPSGGDQRRDGMWQDHPGPSVHLGPSHPEGERIHVPRCLYAAEENLGNIGEHVVLMMALDFF